jgi:DNA-directed RNA polymerase specialized sigma24 family protein
MSKEAHLAASNPAQITRLLIDWRGGDQAALEQLIPLVHDELRRLARRHMAHEHAGHTLQATALVNEAYVRLIDVRQVKWQDRAHFFAMSSRLMRRILVDFARSKGYQKRGGGAQKVSFDEALVVSQEPGTESRGARRRAKRVGGVRRLAKRRLSRCGSSAASRWKRLPKALKISVDT